jgi:hypothetical protein
MVRGTCTAVLYFNIALFDNLIYSFSLFNFMHCIDDFLTNGFHSNIEYVYGQIWVCQVTIAKPNQAFAALATGTPFVYVRGQV